MHAAWAAQLSRWHHEPHCVLRADDAALALHLPPRACMQLALVPRLAQAMGSGGPSVLREREAVALLRAALEPDALLNAQQLSSFHSALQVCQRARACVAGCQHCG